MKFLKHLMKDESGVSSIEYGMIAVVVAIVLAAIMPIIGADIEASFNGVSDKM